MLRGTSANIPRLRQQFEQWLGRQWRGSDQYLRELTREANNRQQALDLMLENEEKVQ